MRTIGLDVHRRFAEAAIIDGPTHSRRRIETTPEALREFASELKADDQVVLEATANTWAIADLLASRAGRVVVSNPLRTRAIADAKCKTDEVDARVLAQLLAADFIPEVWVPDAATRALRRRVAHRASLVGQRTRLRNRIHAVLMRNLVSCPYSDLFGRAGLRWLAEVALPEDERGQVASALRLLGVVDAEISAAERTVAELAVGDERVQLLLSMSGVGALTALALLAVIGPIERFSRPNKLVGYLGLDPTVRQSGERPARTGHISRQGQAHARGLLVEAALDAIRSPGPLHAFYERVRARRGPQIAAVAVARKLAVIIWHVLSKRTEYRWAAPVALAQKRRRVELAAGAPRKAKGPGRRAATPQREQLRQQRGELEHAEREYRAQVRARMKRDAAAATGARR